MKGNKFRMHFKWIKRRKKNSGSLKLVISIFLRFISHPLKCVKKIQFHRSKWDVMAKVFLWPVGRSNSPHRRLQVISNSKLNQKDDAYMTTGWNWKSDMKMLKWEKHSPLARTQRGRNLCPRCIACNIDEHKLIESQTKMATLDMDKKWSVSIFVGSGSTIIIHYIISPAQLQLVRMRIICKLQMS